MSFRVRFTAETKSDLEQLYGFLVEHDLATAERALNIIGRAWSLLEQFPFSCRKADEGDSPFLRELVIAFGDAGYVALFEIDDDRTVTGLAVRHRREDNYY